MFMNYKIILLIKNKQKVNNKLILHVYYFSLFLEVVVYDFYNNKEQGLINYQVRSRCMCMKTLSYDTNHLELFLH